jgi:hypothetical protein
MIGERAARSWPETGHDVKHPLGQAGFQGQFADPQCRQWRLFGRLEHDRVTARQRDGGFAAGQHRRRIPWDDDSCHAERLAQREVKEIFAARSGLAKYLIDPARGFPHASRRAVREHPCALDHQSEIKRVELGQLLGVLLDQVGPFVQVPGAFGRLHPRPWPLVEGFASGLDRFGDIFFVALADVGNQLLIGGINHFESFAGAGRHPSAPYQEAFRRALQKFQSCRILCPLRRNFNRYCRCHFDAS